MYDVDRMAVIIKPTQEFADWLNTHVQEVDQISLEELQSDSTVLLIPIADDEQEIAAFLQAHYLDIFETELEAWLEDESTWPETRSLEVFNNWFEVECHSVVFDLAESEQDEFVEEVSTTTLQ